MPSPFNYSVEGNADTKEHNLDGVTMPSTEGIEAKIDQENLEGTRLRQQRTVPD